MNEKLSSPAGHSHVLSPIAPLNTASAHATDVRRSVRDSLAPSLRRTRRKGDRDARFFDLAKSVEARDASLGQHCERLAIMASTMGIMLGLQPHEIRTLCRAGYLHDIGKTSLPDSILLKPGPLTQSEWELMKTHPARGEEICRSVSSLKPLLPIIRHHHENWDGSGYPDRLKGEDIPLLARIMQMADIYDALTSDRPYKKAFTPDAALQIMRDETRRGLRDPNLLAVVEVAVPQFGTPSFWESGSFSLNALSTSLQG